MDANDELQRYMDEIRRLEREARLPPSMQERYILDEKAPVTEEQFRYLRLRDQQRREITRAMGIHFIPPASPTGRLPTPPPLQNISRGINPHVTDAAIDASWHAELNRYEREQGWDASDACLAYNDDEYGDEDH